jgi:Zn-dependent protease with chaperone function
MLAHELAYQHTFDLWGKYIVNLFAPKGCAIGLLLGFGLGLGPLLLWVPWRSYWRNREYAADEFAARIGQRFQLIGALETLFLRFYRAYNRVAKLLIAAERFIVRSHSTRPAEAPVLEPGRKQVFLMWGLSGRVFKHLFVQLFFSLTCR